MTRGWNGYLVRVLRELASQLGAEPLMQPIRFRSEQSINEVKIKRLAYGGGGKNNPQRLVAYNDGFVLYIAAQCNFVYLHVLRESAILVSGEFISTSGWPGSPSWAPSGPIGFTVTARVWLLAVTVDATNDCVMFLAVFTRGLTRRRSGNHERKQG